MRSNTANMQIHAVFCYREGVLKIYIQTTTWHCVWGSQRGWERTPTSVICSSCSSNGLPSFLLKNVAMPTISSFLLTMGSDRTFLMTNPVSSTASFWKTRRCVLYVLCFRVMCINHPSTKRGKSPAPGKWRSRLQPHSSCCKSASSHKKIFSHVSTVLINLSLIVACGL